MEGADKAEINVSKEDYSINGVSLSEIRNHVEIIVIQLMKQFIPQFSEFDKCPVCIEDVYALSLSRIPSVYMKNSDQVFADDKLINESIEEIVKYAIFQVMSNPKHEKTV
jgi:Late competence development protein ComFB